MEGGDSGRSAGERKRDRTVAVILQVSDLSDGTDCESEGAFTPTESPCTRMCPDGPKVGDLYRDFTKQGGVWVHVA